MNRKKIIIILIDIIITILVLSMSAVTYAYFTVKVEGEGKDINLITFNENTNIIYTDTSNVSMVNGYTGDSIVKRFTIENTSNYDIYYDIRLKNVTNNFSDPEDLVYEIYSRDGAYRNTSMVPTSDSVLASNIKIASGKKHEYTMKITFLETENNQNDNMNRTFSSNIDITPSPVNIGSDIFEKNSIGEKVVKDLVGSEYLINNAKDETTIKNGTYYTNSSIDGKTIYFYRGDNKLKNNVVMFNNCYKMIRTTEDKGVRLIYNGKYENGECDIEKMTDSIYNSSFNYNAYVGFMFGDVSSKNYANEHNNTKNSDIKSNLDNWYLNNLAILKNIISNDTIYCNNRKPIEISYNRISFGSLGYADNNTAYYPLLDRTPSYDCINVNDRFGVGNGNKMLNYSIGLITTDELYFAGFKRNEDNLDNYLYINKSYWTMSPAYYNGSAYVYKVDENGRVVEDLVTNENGVRPVITVNGNTKISSGNGSIEKPFILE